MKFDKLFIFTPIHRAISTRHDATLGVLNVTSPGIIRIGIPYVVQAQDYRFLCLQKIRSFEPAILAVEGCYTYRYATTGNYNLFIFPILYIYIYSHQQ